ncbi:MAG TPA: patatin-like phospholipase family protein [Polyangia bacterium]|nr:patatin-like phospholipase family protein [Polyangia bacterium]
MRRRLRAAAVSVLVGLAVGSCAHKPPQFDPSARRTCLVLSVGGPRGVAHLGAIAAVREAGIHVDCVVGNSMGSLVGGLYAAAPAQDTEALFKRFSAEYIAATKAEAAKNGALGAAVGGVVGAAIGAALGGKDGAKAAAAAGAVLGAGGGFALGAGETAKLDRDRLVRVMDRVLGGARIERLPVAYATTFQQRSDNGLSLVVARDGDLAEAVGRSIANPFIFSNLDVVKQGQVDPGADRASMTPVDEACRLFPDSNLLAINVTDEPAFYRAEMRCPLREVRVDPGPLDAEAVFRLEADFTRAVKAGHDATALALR